MATDEAFKSDGDIPQDRSLKDRQERLWSWEQKQALATPNNQVSLINYSSWSQSTIPDVF